MGIWESDITTKQTVMHVEIMDIIKVTGMSNADALRERTISGTVVERKVLLVARRTADYTINERTTLFNAMCIFPGALDYSVVPGVQLDF